MFGPCRRSGFVKTEQTRMARFGVGVRPPWNGRGRAPSRPRRLEVADPVCACHPRVAYDPFVNRRTGP
jgi:hypothetical protein